MSALKFLAMLSKQGIEGDDALLRLAQVSSTEVSNCRWTKLAGGTLALATCQSHHPIPSLYPSAFPEYPSRTSLSLSRDLNSLSRSLTQDRDGLPLTGGTAIGLSA
jgi:hypothetical protein